MRRKRKTAKEKSHLGIRTIHQAMRAGGVNVKVKDPEKYLHSSRREK